MIKDKKFKITSPLTKSLVEKVKFEKNGSLILEGVASTNNPDLEGDIISRDCISSMKKQAQTLNIHADHLYDIGDVIGNILSVVETDDSLLMINFNIIPSYAVKVKELLDAGVKLGLSIGGVITNFMDNYNDDGDYIGWIIYEIKLLEISLTPVPANWDTYGTVKPSNVDFVESKCLQGACKLIRKNLENEDNNRMEDEGKSLSKKDLKNVLCETFKEFKSENENISKDEVLELIKDSKLELSKTLNENLNKELDSFKSLEYENIEKTFENKNLELEEYKKNLKEDLDNKFSTSYETEEFNTYIQESLDGFKEDIFKEVYSRVEGEILKNLSNTRRPESSFKVENYDDSHKVGNFNQRVMNIKDITNEVFQEKSNSNPFQRVYKEIQKTE